MRKTLAAVLCVSSVLAGCSTTERNSGSCTTNWDDARMLLDCFEVDEFRFARVEDPSGAPVVPARFTWKAPNGADLVVCAVFGQIPTFENGALTDFRASAAFYTVHDFAPNEPREGTFDLETAIVGGAICPWKVAGAGCFAYSLTKVIGTTALRTVSLAGAHVSSKCAVDCSVGRRLGSEVDASCLPLCTDDLQCMSCDDGLCHGLLEPDGGS